MDRDEAFRAIEEIIGPFIGRHMARAAIELHSKKLAVSPGPVKAETLRPLVHDIAKGMVVLVGRDKSAELTQKVEAVLGLAPTGA